MKKSILLLLAIAAVTLHSETTPGETSRLTGLLGKDIRGKEAQEYLNGINSKPEIKKYKETAYEGRKIPASSYYSYKDKGLSIRLDERGFIETIFFYSEGADEFRQYQGSLPHGLDFTMSRKVVEKTIGLPAKVIGGEFVNVQTSYPAKRMSISYDSKERGNTSARIHTVILSNKP